MEKEPKFQCWTGFHTPGMMIGILVPEMKAGENFGCSVKVRGEVCTAVLNTLNLLAHLLTILDIALCMRTNPFFAGFHHGSSFFRDVAPPFLPIISQSKLFFSCFPSKKGLERYILNCFDANINCM